MNILIGFLYGLVAQVCTFMQLQGSIKYGWYVKYPIIIILASIPSGWLFLKSVQHFVLAFNGEIWPSRLIGYGIGVVVFTLMSYYLFKEPLSVKTLVCLALSVAIILIQILWK
jgi:multidrug transporter EmrE-like cation transporter